ncbi:MAG TPA: hypothetical protein PK264_19120 [Hyphomicrobiaceae bacterium]|nr:hypothetical protein [Hyphomicrobiaceae bacterium]
MSWNRRSTSGNALWNARIRGTNQCVTKAVDSDSSTTCFLAFCRLISVSVSS